MSAHTVEENHHENISTQRNQCETPAHSETIYMEHPVDTVHVWAHPKYSENLTLILTLRFLLVFASSTEEPRAPRHRAITGWRPPGLEGLLNISGFVHMIFHLRYCFSLTRLLFHQTTPWNILHTKRQIQCCQEARHPSRLWVASKEATQDINFGIFIKKTFYLLNWPKRTI